jgi:hypothetical protein
VSSSSCQSCSISLEDCLPDCAAGLNFIGPGTGSGDKQVQGEYVDHIYVNKLIDFLSR